MLASNDNKLSEDWQELCLLNDLAPIYSAAEMWMVRMGGPRSVANSLWFLRFDRAFRDDTAKIMRSRLRAV